MGRCVSLDVHFLLSHLDFLPEIPGEVSEQQSERFHQDIKSTEYCCQGFWEGCMKAYIA
jgi:hypothetical protein